MKQCKIFDIKYHVEHGGILLNDGSVICGCCGGLLPAEEKDKSWILKEVYNYWVDISEEIIGE